MKESAKYKSAGISFFIIGIIGSVFLIIEFPYDVIDPMLLLYFYYTFIYINWNCFVLYGCSDKQVSREEGEEKKLKKK